MVIHKAYRFKLKATQEQEATFRRYAGAARWVWNYMLADWNHTYRETKKSPSFVGQMKRLTVLKHEPETAWLGEVNAQMLQQPIHHLHEAWGRFFAKIARRPRFKKKKRARQSFSFTQSVKVDGTRVYLPKIGWVTFRKSREVEGTIKGATVSQRAGKWYVSIKVELEVPDPVLPPLDPAGVVGLDLGLTDFAVLSTGERIPNPRCFRKGERRIAKAKRKLARCKRGSKRYQKQKAKVARLEEQVANQRRDFHHKLSHRLTTENQGLMVEDLSVKGLARTRLAKSVHDAGWGEFLRQLAYKSAWRGVRFHKIDRFYPSTRLHRACGTLNTVTLKDRHFVCQGCGALVDRDLNAAHNIKWRGLEELGYTP